MVDTVLVAVFQKIQQLFLLRYGNRGFFSLCPSNALSGVLCGVFADNIGINSQFQSRADQTVVKLDCAGCKPLFYQTGIKFSYAYLINFGNLRFSYVGIPDGIIPGSQIVASGASLKSVLSSRYS